MAKAKAADAPSSGTKVSGDMKTIQINNKLNNNATIEAQHDDVHAMDKNDLKIIKAKNAVIAATTTTTTSAAIMGMAKPIIDTKAAQKSQSGSNNASDVANKSNNNIVTNNATAAALKNPVKAESTKKKSKEKDQKAAEEKRRQQEEEEERKRLELIAAQRKANLVDQNAVRTEQGSKRNDSAASVGECDCRN